jgi:CheY-like chemotaxis protein
MERQSTVVSALSHDVFFGMRIRTVLQNLGYELRLCKTEEELLTAAEGANLALVDFNKPVNWETLRPILDGEVPVIAFSSHTNVEGFRAAKSAGVTRVVSNGEFSRNLPALMNQYRRT